MKATRRQLLRRAQPCRNVGCFGSLCRREALPDANAKRALERAAESVRSSNPMLGG
jgi:hypothetical protein